MDEGQGDPLPGSRAHCLLKSSGMGGGRYQGLERGAGSNHPHKEGELIPTKTGNPTHVEGDSEWMKP